VDGQAYVARGIGAFKVCEADWRHDYGVSSNIVERVERDNSCERMQVHDFNGS